MGKRGTIKPTTFVTSRESEFCSEKELTTAMGIAKNDWPLAAAKELIDNALDACEETGVPPEIRVTLDKTGICVSDNGPGIPAETIQGMIDFSVRVSSREAYVGPTRGAQGHALKTLIAMPYVLDGHSGCVDVTACGERHHIQFRMDEISQQPHLNVENEKVSDADGTNVKIWWPDSACSILTAANARFLQFVDHYTYLNPHLRLDVNAFGQQVCRQATKATWRKWCPNQPAPADWYDLKAFERLIAAYIDQGRQNGDMTYVREFLKLFKGLSGTSKGKAVLEATDLTRRDLSVLVNGDGFDHEATARLHKAMVQHTKPVKPAALGVIGREHIEARFADECEMKSFMYKKLPGHENGVPVVIETAFARKKPQTAAMAGLGDHALTASLPPRRLSLGLNWSPAIANPFRDLGDDMKKSLDDILSNQRVSPNYPIVFLLHCAHPRIQYTDRGKTAISLSN